jgi:hypothetical protein
MIGAPGCELGVAVVWDDELAVAVEPPQAPTHEAATTKRRDAGFILGTILLRSMGNELAFDDGMIEKLRLAAEEVAWLTGRGYPIDRVGDFVANQHHLGDGERSALASGTCSEPQYRRRAARELEAEDVARRPLSIDTPDVLSAIEAALGGRPVLQTLDGTVRAFGVDAYSPGAHADDALARIFAAAKELRPSILRFLVPSSAADLEARITSKAKDAKAKAEVVKVADVRAAMKKEKQVVTGDALVLDDAGAWFNLVGRVLEGIPSAKIVKLQ